MKLSKEDQKKLRCNINDYVVYKRYGICQVEDIRYEKLIDDEKLCYVLNPLYENKSKVFLMVDSPAAKDSMHPVLTKEEIDKTIEETEKLDETWVTDAKKRQQQFEQILSGGDRVEILWIVKILGMHKAKTEKEGKKFYASDERIFSRATKMITEEFAFVLDIKPSEVVPYILKKIEK